MIDPFLSPPLPQLEGVTAHPFVQRLASGRLPSQAFTAWMVQGLYINDAMIRYQAHLLRKAPASHRKVLAVLLVTLCEDADWLEEHFSPLQHPLYADTERYCRLFTELERLPYPLALALDWCLHRSYQQLWREAVPTSELMEFMWDRWASEEIQSLMAQLEGLVRPVWSEVDPNVFVPLLRQLLRFEMGIWTQALGDGAPH
ncbi:MAG: hypothetical protein C4333_09925 [Meiothermus sp.]